MLKKTISKDECNYETLSIPLRIVNCLWFCDLVARAASPRRPFVSLVPDFLF